MRGLSKAAVIFTAPALAAARPFIATTTEGIDRSHALIRLDVDKVIEDVFIQETLLRVDILESDAACGYGNITLDGQTLYQDETGFGSGSLTTEHGNLIIADWKFTCAELDDKHQEQQFKFDVIYIDENKVRDVGFIVQFRQVAPVAITSIDGAEYVVKELGSDSERGDIKGPSTSSGLDDELALLDMMRSRVIQLENAIAKKEKHISETFDLRNHLEEDRSHLTHCDSLRCVVKSVLNNVKSMTHRVYPDNHHRPPPPPPPPSPPFCHCEPPPYQGHQYGKRPPPPPKHEIPSSPPHAGFPHDSIDEFRDDFQVQSQKDTPSLDEIPEFHHYNSHERPMHAHPTDDEVNHATPLPPSPPPPPPPPHREGLPPPPPHGKGLPPPPPFHGGGPPPPPPPPIHGGRPPPHHVGPGKHIHNLAETKFAILVFAVLTVLGLIISAVHTRCYTTTREQRRARCEGRRCRGQTCCEKRAARNAAIRTRFLALSQRLRESAQAWGWQWRRSDVEGDEEKEGGVAVASSSHQPRHLQRSSRSLSLSSSSRSQEESEDDDDNEEDSDSDALSTTMEQELAQFRAVAGVVGDMIAAEEGRRLRAAATRVDTHYTYDGMYAYGVAPPSPTATLPGYASMDEALPPYDEGSNDPRFVADGFRYTPGSSDYSPSSSNSSQKGGSLEENLS